MYFGPQQGSLLDTITAFGEFPSQKQRFVWETTILGEGPLPQEPDAPEIEYDPEQEYLQERLQYHDSTDEEFAAGGPTVDSDDETDQVILGKWARH